MPAGSACPPCFSRTANACSGRCCSSPPTGEAAVRLWQSVTAWTEFPQLYELQRPKRQADNLAIATTFKPYLEARDWVSINRGEVVSFGAADPKP